MTETDYAKTLEHLENASRIFCANQGNLCDADLRARSFVSHAITEIQRALGASGHPFANGASRDPGLCQCAGEVTALAETHRREAGEKKSHRRSA